MELYSLSLRSFHLVLIAVALWAPTALAQQSWTYKLTSETLPLTKGIVHLQGAADLDGNGRKEIIIADFGKFGEQRQKEETTHTLIIIEWEKGQLRQKFKKLWDTRTVKGDDQAIAKYFSAWRASNLAIWTVGGQTTVETIPPYLGLQWLKGKYVVSEQSHVQDTPQVGSWALPWLSPSCYEGFKNTITWRKAWPRECLLGIRDFSGTGKLKLVTIVEKEDVMKNDQAMQSLRIRDFMPGFQIEWEAESPKQLRWWIQDPIDWLNGSAKSGLLIPELNYTLNIFEPDKNKEGYRLSPTSIRKQLDSEKSMGIHSGDYPDARIGRTQRRDSEEYWGYYTGKAADGNGIFLLREVTLKSDLTGYIKTDINFSHNEPYLGIGFFDIKDLDGDGIDEVILVEQTGKEEGTGEHGFQYSDVKDYIRILKWNGNSYQSMWVSPPYTKRGTKLLIEDIKNVGKKQLIALTPNGTVQIWEKQ